MAGLEFFPASLASSRSDALHVVEKLQEHDPSEHRQAVEVAIEPLVLAHDVAAGFNNRGKLLGAGLRESFLAGFFLGIVSGLSCVQSRLQFVNR